MNNNVYQFLYLLSCAVHQCKPDEKELEGINYNQVYSLSRRHSLTSLLADVIQSTSAPEELKKRFMDTRIATLKKSLLFDAEREKILSQMEEKGIYYLPLKGIIINRLYPEYGMREFADNDILYDQTKQKELVKIFKGDGYTVESINKSHHDVFMKKPCLNFEMHRHLISDTEKTKKIYDYCEHVMEKAIKDEDKQFSYHLPLDEFYAFMMMHAYKHASYSGNGLRYLVDQYFFLKKYEEKIDFAKVHSILDSLGFADFEVTTTSLCKKLFEDPKKLKEIDLLPNENEALMTSFASGTYGSQKIAVDHALATFIEKKGGKLDRKTKLKYVLSRLFPPLSWYKQPYPFLYKTKIFIPFFAIYRLFRRGIFNKRVYSEVTLVKKATEKNEQHE